jgi:hypothetical protein
MLSWKLKACTRCGGDLFVDRDVDGWFEQCLQCSYRRELKDTRREVVSIGACSPAEDWSKDAD